MLWAGVGWWQQEVERLQEQLRWARGAMVTSPRVFLHGAVSGAPVQDTQTTLSALLWDMAPPGCVPFVRRLTQKSNAKLRVQG